VPQATGFPVRSAAPGRKVFPPSPELQKPARHPEARRTAKRQDHDLRLENEAGPPPAVGGVGKERVTSGKRVRGGAGALVAGVSPIVDRSIELDELGEKLTLLGDEQRLVAGKPNPSKLGFVCCCC
jgi:hypothetical protein